MGHYFDLADALSVFSSEILLYILLCKLYFPSLSVKDVVHPFDSIMSTYLTCLLVWILGRVSGVLFMFLHLPQINPAALHQQTLLEVPIGFSVAMSCVLANRIILNVRAANKKARNLPAPPYQVTIEEDGSRNTLSDIEMAQLRSLGSQRGPKFNLI